MSMPCFERGWQRTDQLEAVLYASISANALFHNNAPPAALGRCANPVGAHPSAKKSPAWENSVSRPDPAIFRRGRGGKRISSPILEDKSLPSERIITAVGLCQPDDFGSIADRPIQAVLSMPRNSNAR